MPTRMPATLHLPRQWRFTITGAPRTKKNSNIVTTKGKRPRVLPSAAFSRWNRIAQMELARVRARCAPFPITVAVNVRALFYQDVDRADAVGLYQALGDALQEGQIVVNDRLIRQWDGSRLLVDKENPRVEVQITEVL